MFPLSTIAQLLVLFMQAALYGLYVATLIHCLRWLVYTDDGWKQRDGVNKFMLITTILIFLLSTVNLFLLLPLQLYIMGASGDSSIWNTSRVVATEITYVCKISRMAFGTKNDWYSSL